MKFQNLRNKYCEHPLIKPLIDHCEQNNISFELIKETRFVKNSKKNFSTMSTYYAKIGDSLLNSEHDFYFWNDFLTLLINIYRHLGIDYPDNLEKTLKMLGKQF